MPKFLRRSTPPDLSPAEKATYLGVAPEDFLASHLIIFKDKNKPSSAMDTLLLPEVGPKCPEEWKDEAQNHRFVIGNSEYHMFFSMPKGDGLRPSMNTTRFILKVSSDLKDNGQWVYEDLDLKSEPFEKKLGPFVARYSRMMEMPSPSQSADEVEEGNGGELDVVGVLHCPHR